MQFTLIFSKEQLQLIQQSFLHSINTLQLTKEQEVEMIELVDTIDYIFEENETDAIHDMIGM